VIEIQLEREDDGIFESYHSFRGVAGFLDGNFDHECDPSTPIREDYHWCWQQQITRASHSRVSCCLSIVIGGIRISC
jgi:hypothetical protein